MEDTFIAHCCGKQMLKTEDDKYISFKCANRSHGRWFKISKDSKHDSFCSCYSGEAKLKTKDLETFRLYACESCGARYSVFKDNIKVEFEVKGKDSKDVEQVSQTYLSQIWDNHGHPSCNENIKLIFSHDNLTDIIKALRPDITIGLFNHKKVENTNVNKITIKGKIHKEGILKALLIGVIGSLIAAFIFEYFKLINIFENIP